MELTDDQIGQLRERISDPVTWTEWLFDAPCDQWQRDTAYAFANGERVARAVCNGGGKTRIFAGLGTWLLAGYRNSRVIMTAGVYRQCEILRDEELRKVMNKLEGWTLKEGELVHPRGTKFLWYAADKAGYFEGHHADHMGVLIDEAKSVDKSIYEASERCTANKRRYSLAASSTGAAVGWFFDCFTRNREFWNAQQISAYTIPRIPKFIITDAERMRDSNPDLFRSKILAEFTEAEEGSFILLESINRLISHPCLKQKGFKIAGLDCAGGNDDNVIVIREGNEIIDVIIWKDTDTMRAAGRFVTELRNHGINPENVHADSGGVGQGILDRMAELNYSVNRVNFGGSPLVKSETIGNRMTEIWAHMKSEIDLGHIKFSNGLDPKVIERLKTELTTRRVIPQASGRLKLEAKQEMKKRGLPSPDLADALALALQSPKSRKPYILGEHTMSDFMSQAPEQSGRDIARSWNGMSIGRI